MKIIVVGGGLVGSYVAGLLKEKEHDVHIIENRREVYDKLTETFPEDMLTFASGSDPDVLEAAGASEADVLAAVTGTDEVNLVASTLAKMEYGVPQVVARVNHPRNQWLFGPVMGVDRPVNQAALMADMIVGDDILQCP